MSSTQLNRSVSSNLIAALFAVSILATSAPAQTGAGTGLKGSYYSNTTLSGSVALVRTDATVDFQWATTAPASSISSNHYSVRWTGLLEAPVTGAFTFYTKSDDGVRLWVNGKLLINHWNDHSAAFDQSVPINLTAGQKYPVQLEYYEDMGSAIIQLLWSYPGQGEQIIPKTRLYPGDVVLQPAPPVLSRVWVSDLPFLSVTNGYGPLALDKSNGETGNNDGKTLSIGGHKYSYGLGVHARSEVKIALDDRYDMFRSIIGVDDEVGNNGSLIFEVWLDGKRAYQSPILRGNMPGLAIEVPVEDAREMTLIVTDAGDGINYDHADWAEARLEGVEEVKFMSDLNWVTASNGMGPVEKDRANGGATYGDGSRIRLNGTTYRKGLGTKALSNIAYKLGKKYELFSSVIGVDDTATGPGSVIFEVWTGTTRLFNSPVMHRGDPVRHVVLSVKDVDDFVLKVLDAGDGTANDLGDWADAKLLPLGSDMTRPTAPTGLAAAAGNGQIQLTWTASPTATSYNIYRGTSAGNESFTAIATGITTASYLNTGLTNGTKYFYKVRAVNLAGSSGSSNEASATPAGAPPPPPAAPTGLAAAAGNTTIKLTWNAATGATSYNVYRGTAAGAESAIAIATNVTGLSYTNSGLTNGTAYFYKVASVGAGGVGGLSSEVSATPNAPMSSPSGFSASAGDAKVTLNWGAMPEAASFNIYRSTASGAEGTAPIANVTTNSYVNTGLTNGTKYFYKVAAVNSAGVGSMSSEVNATPNPLLGAPTGLTAAPGNTKVTLTWTALTGAATYNVYRGTTTGGEATMPIATNITSTTYANTGLTNGTEYFYKVAAVNSAGPGAMSSEAKATPNAPLSAPTGLTAASGNTQITLNWTAVTGAVSYNVYRSTTSGGEGTTSIANVTTATYTNTGLTNGTKYFYKVAAVNSVGAGSMSNEASATPAPTLPAPSGLTAAPGNARITLTWTAIPDATGYHIYRGTTAGGEATTPIASNVTAATYTNTGLTNGTTYFYKVAAVNAGGVGPQSSEVSATPLAPPVAPTGLTAAGGNAVITLNWTAVSGAATYNVYRGTAANGQGTTALATGLTSPTFANTTVTNGTTYYYKVTAVNVGGESPRSAEVNATPLSPPPGQDPATVSAFRFLRQATWGPKPGEVDRVKSIGKTAFLNEQFAMPPSTYPDTLYTMPVEATQEYFMQLALTGQDQLRQRVAWALHKIWVVSAVEIDNPKAIVNYHRIFLNRAFGNYRDLMRDMTLNPAMGRYLNMLNNKSQTITGAPPNENYARELKQLFTLGLVRLNPDGTQMLDSLGRTIPTYTEDDVKELARVFTGWTFGDGNPATVPTNLGSENYTVPMEPVARFHDTGAKSILGTTFSPGMTASQELDAALDLIFNHPNLPPFVSKQLIQMLVTSNPSPAYVGAVAAVFANNGSGVRGDLTAVIRSILTHPDANLGTPTAGKLMEPALLVISQARTLNATVVDHPFMSDLSEEMGQKVLYPGSVFSYFSPGYRIRGTTLGGPEFQILTSVTALSRVNYMARLISGGFGADVTIDFTPFTSRAADPAALVDYCSLLFMGGQMSVEQRQEIINAVLVTAATNTTERARTALYLTLAGAQFQVDR